MSNLTRHSRLLTWAACLLAVISLAGCGSEVTSTAPSLVIPPGGNATGATSGSEAFVVVDGRTVIGGSAVSGVKVAIEGTTLSATTNGRGEFLLSAVPTGDVGMSFQGAGSSARASLRGLAAGQHVRLEVEIQSAVAQIVSDERSAMGEFGGVVATVNLATGEFTLVGGGAPILTNGDTRWDPEGDLFSLTEMANAHAMGAPVTVEGITIVTSAGALLATMLKAEVDGDGAGLEFQGSVASADAPSGRMTLVGGRVLAVDGGTVWDPLGDLMSVEAVAAALLAGNAVRVEGDGVPQGDGSTLVLNIKAESDDEDDDDDGPGDGFGPLSLRLHPDEWRGEWVTGSSSGSGGDTLEARIEGARFPDIDPTTILMTGPDGAVEPVSGQFKLERFEAEFLKALAIHLVDSVADGGAATITVTGALTDGTPFELTGVVSVRRDDDSAKVIEDAIDDVSDLIEDVMDLVKDGDVSASDGATLTAKLNPAMASLQAGDVEAAVSELNGFIVQVRALMQASSLGSKDGADLIKDASEIIGDLSSAG